MTIRCSLRGTMAMEILEVVPDLDILVDPIGGVGLISGTAMAAKHIKTDIRINGVLSCTYPSMQRSMCEEDIVCADGITIAEGIAVKTAGELTWVHVRELVDDILLVDETSIEHANAPLMLIERTVCEGAGAASFAAILEHPERLRDLKVGVPLTGDNIDLRMMLIGETEAELTEPDGHTVYPVSPLRGREGLYSIGKFDSHSLALRGSAIPCALQPQRPFEDRCSVNFVEAGIDLHRNDLAAI